MISYRPLVETLKERKVDLKDVCKEVGMNSGVLINKMNDNEYIDMGSLDKMCSVLKCNVSDIIEWEEGEQKAAEKCNVNWNFVIEQLNHKSMSLNELSEKCRLNKSSLSHAKQRNSQLRSRVVDLMAVHLGVEKKFIVASPEGDVK